MYWLKVAGYSLPHRQLRKFPVITSESKINSLPHRQLRNAEKSPFLDSTYSLPHRQLRK
jgi:hypothetical protein